MPTYVYKFVETGETIEVRQDFHDENFTEVAHPDSGKMMAVKKVFTPVGVTFKGAGFFKNDNRNKKSASTSSSSDGASSDSTSDSSTSDSSKSDSSTSDSSKSDSSTSPSGATSGASSAGSSGTKSDAKS